MRLTSLYATALLLSTASAWPQIPHPADLLERGRQLLEGRQASSTRSLFNLSITATQGQVQQTSSAVTASATDSASGSATTTQSGSNAQSGSTITTTGNGTFTRPTASDIDPQSPPGGISMITPNPISGATYYKIKDPLTFVWNYTSVLNYPTAVDVLAVASANNGHHTFTLATNQSITATTQAFTWDSGAYQASATDLLLTATYTLVVHDSAVDVTAIPKAGYLGTASQFFFGMYLPQEYTPYAQFKCVTCSGAMSIAEKQTLSVVFGVMAVTILSFTWFTGAAGVF